MYLLNKKIGFVLKKNIFIAFEGIDGSGKSTQVKLLAARLRAAGHLVHTTAEPTGSPIGSLIRNVFTHRIEADPRTVAALFVADRLDHLLNKTDGILKKLGEGYTVISDRYYLSSYAYQGAHVPLEWVIQANAICADILRPDINLLIDISPELSMERIHRERSSIELYETLENLCLVRDKMEEAILLIGGDEHIVRLDGSMEMPLVAADIWQAVAAITGDVQAGI